LNQPVYAMLYNLWNELILPGGALNGAKVVPFGNNITPSLITVYGDLGVLTQPGVLPHVIAWKPPMLQPDQSIAVIGDVAYFQITDPSQPATMFGFAVFTGPGGSGSGTGVTNTLWYTDLMPTPITLHDVTQIVAYVPVIELGVLGTIWGVGQVIQ
jgi:hypothetical protein